MTNRVHPLEIRGFAHSSVDALHPLPERPEESLPLSYIETVRNGNFTTDFTPDTSGRSSPTTDNTLSIANGLCESNTWSTNTGILTGRSSVYSWGNEDEFDRQNSATVKRLFDEIDGMLFEGKHFNGSTQLLSECEEWYTRFPHLRICGFQLLNSNDDGTQLIPLTASDPRVYSQRPQTSVLEDVEEFGAFDSQGLCIEGFHLDPLIDPPESYMDDELNGYYTEFEEEVLAEDGEVVEYFGYDQPVLEEEGSESSPGVKYRRHQRRGYPPVTPNACAKDAVVSQLFDQAWGEVVLWLRDLLSLYSQKVLRDKPQFLADVVGSSDRAIESPLRPFSQSVMSRNIFSSQTRLKPFPSFNPPLDPNSLISAMKVQTVRLNPRAPSASTSHALESRDTETPFTQGRPASCRSVNSQFTRGIASHSSESFIFKNTPFRKNRNLPSLQRPTHLESSKPKTPGSTQDDVMGGIIQGKKLFTEKERLSSPPQAHSNSPAGHMGKIYLPPIEDTAYRETPVHQNRGRASAKQVSFRQSRASSAATEDSRQSLKDRARNFVEPRPSTTAATHSLRNDIPGRRLSTPMGTYAAPLGMYPRGQSRHSPGQQSPLTGIHGVSMSISSHPANEANASTYSHQYDGRGISPVSDEEYEGFKSPGPSSQHSQRRNKLVTSIR